MKTIFEKTLLTLAAFTLLMIASCNSDDGLPDEVVEIETDIFCRETDEGIYFNFELEGLPIEMDLCDLSAQISTIRTGGSRRFDTLYSRTINIAASLGERRIDMTLHGFFYKGELDLEYDRDYAETVFMQDFVFAKEQDYGAEEYIADGNILLPPAVRPSYVEINYHNSRISFTSTEVDFGPDVDQSYQEESSFEIDYIDEIDYQSPDFEWISYNYIIRGTFECELYDEFAGTIKITNGRFRLPFNAPTTEELYQFPF